MFGVAQRVGKGITLLLDDRGTRRGWVVSSTPRPHFTPGKDPVPILQEAGWVPGPVWTGGKSRPHQDSIPDRPDRSPVSIPTELPGALIPVNMIRNCEKLCIICARILYHIYCTYVVNRRRRKRHAEYYDYWKEIRPSIWKSQCGFCRKPMNINTAICMSIVLSSPSSRFYGGRVLFTYQNKSSVVTNKFAVCLSVSRISDCYMQRGMRVTYRPHPPPPKRVVFFFLCSKRIKWTHIEEVDTDFLKRFCILSSFEALGVRFVTRSPCRATAT